MNMNQSLKDLESQLEQLPPRGLSNQGRDRCHSTIDSLVEESGGKAGPSTWRLPRFSTAAAAMVALGSGIGGGWFLGVQPSFSKDEVLATKSEQSGAEFDQLDREAWLITQESPRVYVTENGKIREIFREVEVTKEVVKHRESGVVVTVETTDHHVVDSEKSEF